jgi:hypothetical protein
LSRRWTHRLGWSAFSQTTTENWISRYSDGNCGKYPTILRRLTRGGMWGKVGVDFGGLTIVVVVLWPIFDAKTPFFGGCTPPGWWRQRQRRTYLPKFHQSSCPGYRLREDGTLSAVLCSWVLLSSLAGTRAPPGVKQTRIGLACNILSVKPPLLFKGAPNTCLLEGQVGLYRRCLEFF